MQNVIRYLSLIGMIFWMPLGASMKLERLYEFDKETAVQMLESATLQELWDAFLVVQTDLFFSQEAAQLANQKFWQDANDVLELGSGNGAYLNQISHHFHDKKYFGIEKQTLPALQSEKNFGGPHLQFREGNAEIFYGDLRGMFDVVICRLVLQHMDNPRIALAHAYEYLKENGRIVIMDAYDAASRTSHRLPSKEEAVRLHNEKNKTDKKGNRFITLELLKELNSGAIGDLFEVEFSNLSDQGEVLSQVVKFQGLHDRELSFSAFLMYLAILQKGWDIPVDYSQGYDECKAMLDDESAWICPGVHYMILKKK